MYTEEKAELIKHGKIYIPHDFLLPFIPSCSSAGPITGKPSLIFEFFGKRVKLMIERERCKYELERDGSNYRILKEGKVFLNEVKIIKPILHSPSHAFVSLENRCIYSCAFCSSSSIKKKLSYEKIMSTIKKVYDKMKFDGLAITTGVYPNYEKSIENLVSAIIEIKRVFSGTIGVEAYFENENDIDEIWKAGAREIKINIHSYSKKIFSKLCPQWNYENVLRMIKHACKIFGRGKVCSNLFVGIGEKDSDVENCTTHLAKIGALTNIRAIRIDEFNKEKIQNLYVGIEPKMLISLAKLQRNIFELFCLSPKNFKTMCYNCSCCDIIPFEDV
ncbi:MAG: radical SAM protein [Candidatus Thermoplasmatota archaeon]